MEQILVAVWDTLWLVAVICGVLAPAAWLADWLGRRGGGKWDL